MTRTALLLGLTLAATALSGCVTRRPVVVSQGVGGDAVASLSADGTIRMTVRTADPTGMTKDGVVEFKPGDPAYDVMYAQVEKAWPQKHKPTLTWEIGTPVYGP